MSNFSSPDSLCEIEKLLTLYLRLPYSGKTVPGAVMEDIIAHVHNGRVFSTYDFVDVVSGNGKCGWQVKSTLEKTPVTWKRAKIPNKEYLIEMSRQSSEGLQELGNAIIDFCNLHAKESIETYGLDEIGYARLIVHEDDRMTYFEKQLCTKEHPEIFLPENFKWKWSSAKKTVVKEQLQALHGFHTRYGKKWWAWHGLGENQLHFSGESMWWEQLQTSPQNCFTCRKPAQADKLSFGCLLDLLAT